MCLSLCRWDLQRARALLEHQELLKKYNKKGGGTEPVVEKKKEKIVSFLSKLEDSRSLHVGRWLYCIAHSDHDPRIPLCNYCE